MRLVLASLHLSWLGGATTYLLTVAPALQRLGHEVTLYSPDAGDTAALARERGIRVVTREDDLPPGCDAVLVQDTVTALELRDRYPVPHVFVSHGAELDLAAPPQVDGAIAAAVAMNDRVMARLTALAADVPVVRLRQPIDIEVFCPRGPLRERPEEVLLLGNYLTGRRRDVVTRACSDAGLRWTQVGAGGTMLANPAQAIARADIVIGYGRSVLEAMACGRAAYVLDYLGGDGWVTPDSYPRLERDGFTGTTSGEHSSPERLRRDLLAYDRSMGEVNRSLIYSHHTAFEHARQLAELFKSIAGRAERLTSGRELARLARLQWHADWRASQLWTELDEEGAALREQERRAADAERRAAEAERRYEALVATRRWRVTQRLLRPLDRLRQAIGRRRR
jgi:hypothetical protein